MRDTFEFDAVLQRPEKHPTAAYIDIPLDVAKIFGTRGQVKVSVTIDGEPYRGSIAPMGTGCHSLIIRKDIRQKIGKHHGEAVHVVLRKDNTPRTVTVPADLQEALAGDAPIAAHFASLSYTHRKEFVQWIESAKRAETRQRRIAKAMSMLRDRKTL